MMDLSDRTKKAIIWSVVVLLSIPLGLVMAAAVDELTDQPGPEVQTPTPQTTVLVEHYPDAVCYREQPSGRIIDCDPRGETA